MTVMTELNENIRNYLYYEEQYKGSHNRKCIDGRIIGSSKCVGYCQFKDHSGYLTKKQMKEHGCLKKECFHYLPKLKNDIEEKSITAVDIVKSASAAIKDFEGMKIIRARKEVDGSWIIRYTTITNMYQIPLIEKMISEIVGEMVTLVKLNCDFDLSAKLVFAM